MNFIWDFEAILNKEGREKGAHPLLREVLRDYPARHILFFDEGHEDVFPWLEEHKLRHYFGSHVYCITDIVSFLDRMSPLLNGDRNYLIISSPRHVIRIPQVSLVVMNPCPYKDKHFVKEGEPMLVIRDLKSIDLLLEVDMFR
jgi:hypothetical protein